MILYVMGPFWTNAERSRVEQGNAKQRYITEGSRSMYCRAKRAKRSRAEEEARQSGAESG